MTCKLFRKGFMKKKKTLHSIPVVISIYSLRSSHTIKAGILKEKVIRLTT